jgi:predicted transcriptional regulator
VRRSTADLEQTSARILAYVRSNPGQRLEEIGRGLDTATAGLKRPIQALLASGSLRTEGQKRGTRYFAGGRKGKGRAKGVKNVRGPKAAKAKARKANVRKTKRKARKARRPVRVVTVRPKATERVAVEAAAKTVPAETASAAT